MFHLLSCVAIATPVVAYLVPLLATLRPRARRIPANTMATARRRIRHGTCTPEQQREWAARQFAFGRAIKDYEELIDSIAARVP